MDTDYFVSDIKLAQAGQKKIDWVAKSMNVLYNLYQTFLPDGIFKNKKISMCIHLEAKSAYLATIIKKLGAEVWITGSNVLSTKDDICAALAKNGIHVYAKYGASSQDYASYIESISCIQPHVVVDDGGDVCEFIHENREYGTNLKGFCEETTTGVLRLRDKYQKNQLAYPAIAINDAKSKYLFDNRYGTGQSTWTAIMHLTNMTVVGKTVVSIGYGWVGRGVTLRAAGLGADVIVVEIKLKQVRMTA